MTTAHRIGARVIETQELWCDGCNASASFAPGVPSRDGLTEIRECEDGHEKAVQLYVYVPLSEAIRPDLD